MTHAPACGWQRLGLLLMVLAFSAIAPLEARPVLPLPASGSMGEIKSVSWFRADPERALQPGDLMFSDEGFAPFDPSLNQQTAPVWLKLELIAPSDSQGQYVLRVARRFFTRFDLYTTDSNGELIRRSATATEAIDARTVGRDYIFDLQIPAASRQTLLIHVETFQQSLQPLEMTIQDGPGFAASQTETYLVFGLIFGILLALIFHNFVLYLNLRQSGHLYYVLAMSATLLLLGIDSGMLQNYLLPDALAAWVGRLNILFAALLVVTIFLFFQAFVDGRSHAPRLTRSAAIVVVVIAIMALLQLAMPPLPFAWLSIGIQLANVLVMCLLIVASLIAARRGSVEGAIFLAAWSIYVLSAFARTLLSLDMSERNPVFEYLMYFAAVAEASILALGLSYRVRLLYQRHATALEEQNRAAMLANLDPLTNAWNRRFLQTFLNNALKQQGEGAFKRCVLILDLDHFKEANDEYGHAAGDLVLRELVQRCRLRLGEDDIMCRLGGDEFVIVTGENAERSGMALAEALIEEFRDQPFRFEGQSMPVTISIGVVSKVASESTVSDVLRMADQALYQAKQAGRNRAWLFDPKQATPFRHGPSMAPARDT